MKQLTLSRSIRQLEYAFGVQIFKRSSSGVRATPIGGISYELHVQWSSSAI
jgi:DNA-binding transcriptional LysR family regulator